jgi:hypothetical protein
MADEKRRLVFGRSLSEKLRCSTTGETVERIWTRLRQVKLQGILKQQQQQQQSHSLGVILIARGLNSTCVCWL